MRTFARRSAPLVAAAYLLAGWLAGALHAHVPTAAGDEVCTTCACGHHHHSATDEQDEDRHSDRKSGGQDEHDCVVCHFFAQPPLAIDAVCIDQSAESLPLRAPKVVARVEATPQVIWWSRGPPVV